MKTLIHLRLELFSIFSYELKLLTLAECLPFKNKSIHFVIVYNLLLQHSTLIYLEKASTKCTAACANPDFTACWIFFGLSFL